MALHIWKSDRIRSISHVFLYLITKKDRLPRPDSAYFRQSPVIQADAHGPTIVQWNQSRFTRRSGDGKFGNAVWYSRPLGKGEEGAGAPLGNQNRLEHGFYSHYFSLQELTDLLETADIPALALDDLGERWGIDL